MPPQQPLHEQSEQLGQAYVAEITVIVPPNVQVNIQQRSTNATPETQT